MSIKSERKLKEIYKMLLKDGYNAELLGKEDKPLYVAVPCVHRVVVIGYYDDPYYDVGEIGYEFATTRLCLGFFHAFEVYTTGIIEKYVKEIVPNPILNLGGIEKYKELCALDESDPDFFKRAGILFEEYTCTKGPDEYQRVYKQWKHDECLIVL